MVSESRRTWLQPTPYRNMSTPLKNAPLVLVFLILSTVLAASHHPYRKAQIENRFPHHPVRTNSRQAQSFFDQGLGLIYALDYSGAANAFRAAARSDPAAAMAYWGIAYALGSDYYYHTAGDPRREQEANDAVKRAAALVSSGPQIEKEYVDALSRRYCNCPNPDRGKQAVAFKNAMAELVRDYPDDLDAANLYAQSIMNLSAWDLWNPDGTPQEGTPEVLAVLEAVLKRDPRHWGAIHYYIHAVEASPNPERALVYVQVLPNLIPPIGHLVHMPAHIYIRTGDYAAAEAACRKAAALDESHLESATDMFTVFSYLHDLYFLAAAASMDNHYLSANAASVELAETVTPHVKGMPQLQVFLTVHPAVLLRFHRWADILGLPEPDREYSLANTFWHYARGMAFAATSSPAEAEAEQRTVAERMGSVAPGEIFGMSALNKTSDIMTIETDVLAAKLLEAKHERREAIARLREAVAIQDSLRYAEPPSWFYPVRESLGAALFLDGRMDEAERTFRDDLARNPRNPRSLFGLLRVLQSTGRSYDAGVVQAELKAGGHEDLKSFDLLEF
jgi:tetratricopeptide (TPR) repeat protein